MRVRYMGPFSVPTGYARACHDYLMALRQVDVELSIEPIHEANTDDLEGRYEVLLPLVHGFERGQEDIVIVHTIPRYAHEFVTGNLTPAKHVKKVVLTTWETDKLPAIDAENLNKHFHQIVVPSAFNHEIFERAGVPNHKLQIIPHCFDPDFWVPEPRPVTPSGPFIFYSINAWADRKNPIGLLKAYWSEFTSEDNVVLRLVGKVNEDDITTLARCMGIDKLAKVEILDERLNELQLLHLHRSSDCYVSATRGEGWGLGAFEAAIMGNGVIITDWSAPRDWLKGTYVSTWLIPYHLTPAVTPEVKVGSLEVAGLKIATLAPMAPTGIDGTQHWAEPDLFQFKVTMRHVFRTRSHLVDEAFRERYSYKTVGEQFKQVLKFLMER